jgi:hypothetical protein
VHSNFIDDRQTHLVRIVIRWHFSFTSLWEPEFMSKLADGGEPKKVRPTAEESSPPLLSEKLIAQLQGAVSAAQRKRMSDPHDASATRPRECGVAPD